MHVCYRNSSEGGGWGNWVPGRGGGGGGGWLSTLFNPPPAPIKETTAVFFLKITVRLNVFLQALAPD